MTGDTSDWRALAALYLLGLVIHAGWATAVPLPVDWDPAYYRTVALHLLAGDGWVTGSLWNLSYLPDELPMPADLHWMPLPSWVLLPGLLIWPAHGDQVVTVLVAATWGPLAWWTGRELGIDAASCAIAGALAALGLWYQMYLSTPDSIALSGLVGGAAVLLSARQRLGPTMALLAVFAWIRNDGFLLAPCLAVAFLDRGALSAAAVAASGPLATLAWWARNFAVAGADWWRARAMVARALHPEDVLRGSVPPVDLGERLAHFGGDSIPIALFIWLVVLPLPTVFVIWRHQERWVRAGAAYMIAMPLVTQVLAPGVAASGTLFRSMAAVFPLACVVTAAALMALGRWGERVRGYHPLFLAGLGAASLAAFATLSGPMARLSVPEPFDACRVLDVVPPAAPVFSLHPLLVEARCGHPGVVLLQGIEASRAAELSDRYGVAYAVAYPADYDERALTSEDLARVLPGWAELRPGVWVKPPAAGAGAR